MRNILLIFLHLAVLGILAFIFYDISESSPDVKVVEAIKTDTIRITDTITIAQPTCVEKRVTDTIIVHTTDTLMREVVVLLPREERVYQDSNYRAVISGYKPSLDSIQVYQHTERIKVTEQIPSPRWAVGVQGGVGVTPKGVQPYIGIGVSYRINK